MVRIISMGSYLTDQDVDENVPGYKVIVFSKIKITAVHLLKKEPQS